MMLLRTVHDDAAAEWVLHRNDSQPIKFSKQHNHCCNAFPGNSYSVQ